MAVATRFAGHVPLPVSRPYDEQLAFQKRTDGVLSATTRRIIDGESFNPLSEQTFKVSISHDAISSVTPGVNEWQVDIEVSEDGSTGWQTVTSVVLGADATVIDVALNGPEVDNALGSTTAVLGYLSVNIVQTGAPGDLTADIFVSKDAL